MTPALDAAPPRRRPQVGVGSVLLGIGLAAVGAALAGRAVRQVPPRRLRPEARQRALARSRTGSAILSFSVLADSTMEHYRGGFHHSSMFAAPTAGALSLAAAMAEPERGAASGAVMASHITSVAVGAAGMAYHLRNVSQRPGGICWNNLFYAAPLGAPGSLATAGLLGAVAHAMAASHSRSADGADLRHGRQLAALSAVALMGETAEVALLHFRGAFHNPSMYLPVTIPPAAALALLSHAARPGRGNARSCAGCCGRSTRSAWSGPAFTSTASRATWAAGGTGARTRCRAADAGADQLHRPWACRAWPRSI